MLSKEEIIDLASKKKQPKIMGIYFFVRNGKILYIGSCKDVYRRVISHKQKHHTLKSSNWSYIPYDKFDKMLIDEKTYIENYTPKYNIKDNPEAEKEMLLALKLSGSNKKTLGRRDIECIFKQHKIRVKHKRINI